MEAFNDRLKAEEERLSKEKLTFKAKSKGKETIFLSNEEIELNIILAKEQDNLRREAIRVW